MEKNLNRLAFEATPDNLIYSLKHPFEVTMVSMDVTGLSVLHRGSLLGKSTDGSYALMGKEGFEADSIVVTECLLEEETGEAPITVYQTGSFNQNALFVAEGYTLTEKDKETLRKKGIFIHCAETY